ncbi:MAG: RluA family pseudouridine synthase [Alphaproteobacteria bacterium]|nr:RluA family pseudouridine synthase [Alphaproteobacteria bacterium]
MAGVETRIVAEDEGDIRLDRWFRRHFPDLGHGQLAKLLRTGQVRVDGKRAETGTRLQPGQSLRIPPLPVRPAGSGTMEEGGRPAAPRPPRALSAADLAFAEGMVLYRDPAILVLNKPYGLPVQGGPGITRHLDGLLDALRFEAPDRPRLVHRLDRDTTGILVLARSAATASALAAAFRTRAVEKIYWAVVVGRPLPPEGRIDAALAKLPGPRGERVALVDRGAEDSARAITDYATLDHAGRRASWLELRPHTGRTHQLRVHCLALGTPILGDGKYGGAAAHMEGFSNQLHLHARAIVLPHPSGGMLEAAVPAPEHMAETFRQLGFQAPATPPPRRTGARNR